MTTAGLTDIIKKRKIHVTDILIISTDPILNVSWHEALSEHFKVDLISVHHLDIKRLPTCSLTILDVEVIETYLNDLSQLSEFSGHILITGDEWPEQQQINALILGASGYCAKSISLALLKKAVDCILKGDIWIQRHLIPSVIGALVKTKLKSKSEVEHQTPATDLKSLSHRELEVAQMISTGENNKTIARTLNISERTVKAHLTSIFKKLNISDRLHLALYFQQLSH